MSKTGPAIAASKREGGQEPRNAGHLYKLEGRQGNQFSLGPPESNEVLPTPGF